MSREDAIGSDYRSIGAVKPPLSEFCAPFAPGYSRGMDEPNDDLDARAERRAAMLRASITTREAQIAEAQALLDVDRARLAEIETWRKVTYELRRVTEQDDDLLALRIRAVDAQVTERKRLHPTRRMTIADLAESFRPSANVFEVDKADRVKAQEQKKYVVMMVQATLADGSWKTTQELLDMLNTANVELTAQNKFQRLSQILSGDPQFRNDRSKGWALTALHPRRTAEEDEQPESDDEAL